MARKIFSAFEYPLTIKLIDGYFVVALNDLEIIRTVALSDGKFDIHTMRALEKAMSSCWKEAHTLIRNRVRSNIEIPLPSKIKSHLGKENPNDIQSRPLTAPEVAKLLQVSESSVRRIPKKLLPFKQPRKIKRGKGHRRYLPKDVMSYLKNFEVSEGQLAAFPLRASKRILS